MGLGFRGLGCRGFRGLGLGLRVRGEGLGIVPFSVVDLGFRLFGSSGFRV